MMSTSQALIDNYLETLKNKAPGTVVGYRRALEAFRVWLAQRPGSDHDFQPVTFTKTAVETYFTELEARYSVSYRTLVKSALSGFADWLIEQELLRRNPTHGLHIEAQRFSRMAGCLAGSSSDRLCLPAVGTIRNPSAKSTRCILAGEFTHRRSEILTG